MIEAALFDGAVAVDATMGNGHDTLWLCRQVGENGHVYAFDVQQQAVDNTAAGLEAAGVRGRAELFCVGHQHMADYVDRPADVIMFNLGWLPGAEHGVTTLRETTLQAADAALTLLKKDGLLTICIYPGHEEGQRELEALMDWAARLDPKKYDALVKTYVNQPNWPPRLLAVRRVK
ncbi:MAG: class I SAM-dependent methyltransferase [Clostridia bacterium]|nr:class I SAM-dependent methyltransferase [Clostridia bacterium]